MKNLHFKIIHNTPLNLINGGPLKPIRSFQFKQNLVHTDKRLYTEDADKKMDKALRNEAIKNIYKKGVVFTHNNLGEWMEAIKWEKHMAWTDKGVATCSNRKNLDTVWKKAGIYMITNNITKKKYIGKSDNLWERFYNYSSITLLKQNLSSSIHRAMVKFGYDKHSITILEHCEKEKLLEREAYYMKIFRPLHNIRRTEYIPSKPLEELITKKKKKKQR